MIRILSGLFIRNAENTDDPKVRSAWGLLCSVLTIVLNALVFAAKYIIGTLAGSVSIMADSFNNLSDAASSVIILFGFKFAGMKPTPDRPFGHGRIEYITGLIVSAMILIVGYSTLRDAISAIANPEDTVFSWVTLAVLLLSVAIKFYMAFYMKGIGKKIDSQALLAAAGENMTDTISTALTIVALLLNVFFSWKLDGWAALIVALLLLKTGIENAWETVKDLLGKKADPELVQKIVEITKHYPGIIGMHDLVIHDYGPGRLFISMHCEVPGNGDIYDLHDQLDRCMFELDQSLSAESVIHMDPVNTDDGITASMREKLSALVKAEIDPAVTIHDFRVVTGPTHVNLIFDCVVPQKFRMTDEEVTEKLRLLCRENFDFTNFISVKIDRPYA